MNIFRKWWKRAIEFSDWTSGIKHPETHPVIFKNVWGCDIVRRVLQSRCHECGFVVSNDDKIRQELVYKCNDPACDCARVGSARSHPVCGVCYGIFHSLYLNYGLTNQRYFRNIDEDEESGRKNGRNRMGL